MSSVITPNAQEQIMLSLAYLAYVDELLPGIPAPDATIKTDLIAALSSSAKTPIPPVAGLWDIVWGPVTYTVPGSLYQDYMMYVAQLNVTSEVAEYAVAVRGTNGKAWLDWLVGDFDVLDMMPWPFGASTSSAVGFISESTNIGLAVLLSMQDPTNGTLFEFLASQIGSSAVTQASICFTGHSLGGTLSYTLALHARDTQASWDPASKATVTTINFAAPTAGDANFAAYFDNAFSYTTNAIPSIWTPPAGFSSYADCIRNSLDLAPTAWNSTTLKAAPATYDLHLLLPAPGTSEVFGYIAEALVSQAYTQIQPTQTEWEGTYQSETHHMKGWLAEVEFQHVDGYPNLLKVPELLQIFSSAVPQEAMAGTKARRLAIRHTHP